tara:strand:+ start:188 stop:313 length:126 start_codon:yes stop_codon:yes gene_type:complete
MLEIEISEKKRVEIYLLLLDYCQMRPPDAFLSGYFCGNSLQ